MKLKFLILTLALVSLLMLASCTSSADSQSLEADSQDLEEEELQVEVDSQETQEPESYVADSNSEVDLYVASVGETRFQVYQDTIQALDVCIGNKGSQDFEGIAQVSVWTHDASGSRFEQVWLYPQLSLTANGPCQDISEVFGPALFDDAADEIILEVVIDEFNELSESNEANNILRKSFERTSERRELQAQGSFFQLGPQDQISSSNVAANAGKIHFVAREYPYSLESTVASLGPDGSYSTLSSFSSSVDLMIMLERGVSLNRQELTVTRADGSVETIFLPALPADELFEWLLFVESDGSTYFGQGSLEEGPGGSYPRDELSGFEADYLARAAE